ncbi:MauE/DoxX family redox-associated membrane protein [Actinoplanes missouriensis]|uniref:MauE/DoxX family redox-associated membrane protein n=1 Tax=Actinoplanes missouriensis TaxID=1866 RepID=UPI0033ED2643
MPVYLYWICRGVLLAVFAVSVLSKVRDSEAYAQFRSAAGTLSGASRRWVPAIAAATVLTEGAVVLGLLTARTTPYAFAVVGALLAVFTAALLRDARSGTPVPCRCFGASTPSGYVAVVRNAALLAVSAAGLWCAAADAGVAPLPVYGALVCVLCVLVLTAGLIRFDHLSAVLTARR